jgi:predicted nucleic acid-binding Zn ribbon protein
MPTYDYVCEANGRVVEVKHRMSERLATWGELCALAGVDCGDTADDAPVQRLATGGQIVNSGSLKDAPPACAAGPCCGGGVCGLDN